MPTIFVNMIEGQSIEKRKELVKRITETAVANVGVTPDKVKVIITERPKENMSIGGVLLSEK